MLTARSQSPLRSDVRLLLCLERRHGARTLKWRTVKALFGRYDHLLAHHFKGIFGISFGETPRDIVQGLMIFLSEIPVSGR
jgi:hypothetical protein